MSHAASETQLADSNASAALRSSDVFGDDRCELLKLAAEMARGIGMPSPFLEDWQLPKTTPLRARQKIRDAADKADEQCKNWAVRLRRIIDDPKSLNDQAHRPPTADE